VFITNPGVSLTPNVGAFPGYYLGHIRQSNCVTYGENRDIPLTVTSHKSQDWRHNTNEIKQK